MSEQSAPATPLYKGDRRCRECGKVHDAHWRLPEQHEAGYTWADPTDGHAYVRESWETVARSYGWSPEAEREQYGVAS